MIREQWSTTSLITMRIPTPRIIGLSPILHRTHLSQLSMSQRILRILCHGSQIPTVSRNPDCFQIHLGTFGCLATSIHLCRVVLLCSVANSNYFKLKFIVNCFVTMDNFLDQIQTLPTDWQLQEEAFTKETHRDVYPAVEPTQPQLSLRRKVVIITGASQGIGSRVRETFFDEARSVTESPIGLCYTVCKGISQSDHTRRKKRDQIERGRAYDQESQCRCRDSIDPYRYRQRRVCGKSLQDSERSIWPCGHTGKQRGGELHCNSYYP